MAGSSAEDGPTLSPKQGRGSDVCLQRACERQDELVVADILAEYGVADVLRRRSGQRCRGRPTRAETVGQARLIVLVAEQLVVDRTVEGLLARMKRDGEAAR